MLDENTGMKSASTFKYSLYMSATHLALKNFSHFSRSLARVQKYVVQHAFVEVCAYEVGIIIGKPLQYRPQFLLAKSEYYSRTHCLTLTVRKQFRQRETVQIVRPLRKSIQTVQNYQRFGILPRTPRYRNYRVALQLTNSLSKPRTNRRTLERVLQRTNKTFLRRGGISVAKHRNQMFVAVRLVKVEVPHVQLDQIRVVSQIHENIALNFETVRAEQCKLFNCRQRLIISVEQAAVPAPFPKRRYHVLAEPTTQRNVPRILKKNPQPLTAKSKTPVCRNNQRVQFSSPVTIC